MSPFTCPACYDIIEATVIERLSLHDTWGSNFRSQVLCFSGSGCHFGLPAVGSDAGEAPSAAIRHRLLHNIRKDFIHHG